MKFEMLSDGELDERLRKHSLWRATGGLSGRRLHLSNFDLRRADFSGIDLSSANFSASDLAGANFRDSNLRDASVSSANLADADLRGSNLTQVRFAGTTVAGCLIDAEAIATSRLPLSWWLEMGAIVEDL